MNKKGILTVEAAIFLPIFLIATISLVCVIRMAGVEENVMNVFSTEAMKVSKEAYISKIEIVPEDLGLKDDISGAIFQNRLKDRIKMVEDLELTSYRYLYSIRGVDYLISGNLHYRIDIPLPAGFFRSVLFEERLVFRGFLGANENYLAMGFDRMEQEEESVIVYIFPISGERYHNNECRLISTYPVEVFLSSTTRKNYRPCKLCNAKEISDGSRVYCYKKSGEVYHRSNCTSVDRYVEAIERADAVKRGYTPCRMCGGD
ncbi:MAG: hypothetical protein GX076_07910 [Clostridiales bacterium]|nr:hypothetical protein [Clostridiales bacterium]